MTMQWEREHKLNISVLDAQHKQLISCLNELEQAMKTAFNQRISRKFFYGRNNTQQGISALKKNT